MITLRLDPKLEKNIQKKANSLGITKSELIRKSVSEFIEKIGKHDPWELGSGVFGKYESGKNNISRDRKSLLKEKIKAKRK